MEMNTEMNDPADRKEVDRTNASDANDSRFHQERNSGADGNRVCPVCQATALIEIRGKLQCSRCHTICETCCEGGRC